MSLDYIKNFYDLCMGLILLAWLFPAVALSQSTSETTQPGTGAIDMTAAEKSHSATSAKAPEGKAESASPRVSPGNGRTRNFHLELGGFYSPNIPGLGTYNWRGWDARLTYTRFKRFAPFGGAANIASGQGGQIAYGVGSYFNVSGRFYLIGGVSLAPTREAEFSPHRRYDVAGMFSVPQVKGMLFSTGLTVLPGYKNSGGGRILAFGDTYYWKKFIFGGSLNLNIAEPGNKRSVSGQFAVTYGMQGSYYISAGASGGGAAYMLISGTPFEVRYQMVGATGSFVKWFTKHSGIDCRYGFASIIGSTSARHSIRIGTFYEF
jgi:YaiO family outer membrane protein